MVEIKQMKVYTVDDVWQVEETQDGSVFQYYARWTHTIDIKVCIGVSQDVALNEQQVTDLMRRNEIGVLSLMKQHEKIMINMRNNQELYIVSSN